MCPAPRPPAPALDEGAKRAPETGQTFKKAAETGDGLETGATVASDVWRIYGRDYDLTPFVDEHPGGALMILLGKGTDCTHLFESYHVINEPRERLRKYDVTPDGLQPAVPECPSEFMRELRVIVREHFKGAGRWAHKSSYAHIFRCALLVVGELASAYWWISQLSLLGAFVTGVFAWLLMANLAHDGSHGAMSRIGYLNYLVSFIGCFPFGWCQCCWWLQHVVSHHQYTNELGHDVDSHHQCFARWHRGVQLEIYGGRILGGIQQVFWHVITTLGSTVGMAIIHPIQFIWVPLIQQLFCGGLGEKSLGRIEDSEIPRHGLFCPTKHDSAFEKVAGNFALQRTLLHVPLMFATNLVCWVLSLVILWAPLFYTLSQGGTVGHGLLMGMIPFMTSSALFMSITQISHIQRECQEAEACDESDYFKRQARTSLDYSADSAIMGFLTGALNTQSIHHVLPSISSVHYRDLYPAFYALCVKHGCEPASCPTVFHALFKHWCYIFSLGSAIDDRGTRPDHTLP